MSNINDIQMQHARFVKSHYIGDRAKLKKVVGAHFAVVYVMALHAGKKFLALFVVKKFFPGSIKRPVVGAVPINNELALNTKHRACEIR